MGEAKRRQTLTAKIIERYPFCIYCGGKTPSATIDHMPPKQIFDFKQRLRGLEFPSCVLCNSETSGDEQIVALLSRVYPDGKTEAHGDEVKKLLDAVSNNCPGLLPSLLPDEYFTHHRLLSLGLTLPPLKKHLRFDAPLVRKAFDNFSLKLFLALHFEHTNEIISASGGVRYWMFTNLSALKGRIPPEFSSLLRSPRTLQQGKLSLERQFSYGFQVDQQEGLGLYFSTFRQAFALGGMVSRDISAFDIQHDEQILRPFKRGI